MGKNNTKNLYCVCGEPFAGRVQLGQHRRVCDELEGAILAEVSRIADKLDRVPTLADYRREARTDLPSVSWITSQVATWTEILSRLGLCEKPITRGVYTACESYTPMIDDVLQERGFAVSSCRVNEQGETVYTLR